MIVNGTSDKVEGMWIPSTPQENMGTELRRRTISKANDTNPKINPGSDAAANHQQSRYADNQIGTNIDQFV